MQWFRLYTDILTDWKLESIAFEDQRHYFFILACKSSGHLDEPYPNMQAMDRAVGRRLGLFGESVEQAKRRLIEVGLIDENWQPLAWSKRQYKSDQDSTSAERQRRYRASKQAASRASRVTSRVTSRGVTANVTRLDTDTDTDTEHKKHSVSHDKIVFDGSSFHNINGYLAKWEDAFPAIQVPQELSKAAAWVMANPKNKKSNWARFLTNWMSKAQDRAPRVDSGGLDISKIRD